MNKVAMRLRETLPYGKWTRKNGGEVLFNRSYSPIWKKDLNGEPTRAKEYWWVPDIVEVEYYYDDSCPPHGDHRHKRTKESAKRCYQALHKFGIYNPVGDYDAVHQNEETL